MARFNEGVDISFRAKLDEFTRDLKKIPKLTEATAKKLTNEWVRSQKTAERESKAAARNAAKAWDKGSSAISSALGRVIPGFDAVSDVVGNMDGVLGGSAKNAKKLAVALGAAAAVAAGITAFVALAKDAEEARSQIVSLTQTTQLLPETLAAIEMTGADIGQLGEAAGEFNKRMLDAAKGGGEAKVAFDALGVSVLDADGNLRSTNEVFVESIEKIQQLDSETERAAYSTSLLGGAGRELTASLGSTALSEWVELSREYGVNVDAAATHTAHWESATKTFHVVMRAAVDDMVSGLGMGGTISQALSNFTVGFEYATTFVSSLFGGLAEDVGEMASAMYSLDPARLGRAFADLSNPLDEVARAGNEATEAARKAWKLGQAMQEAGTAFTGGSGPAAPPVAPPTAPKAPKARAGGGGRTTAPAATPGRDSRAASEMHAVLAAVVAVQEELAAYQEARDEVFAAELQGVDAINAVWDERISKLREHGEMVRGHDALMAEIAEAEKMRASEVASYEAAQRQEAFERTVGEASQTMSYVGQVASGVAGIIGSAYDAAISQAKRGSKEQKRLLKQQAAVQKAAAITQAIVNTALGITNALTVVPLVPLGIAMAGVAGTLGAAQIATISATKAPSFPLGGVVRPEPDHVSIQAQPGEGVVTRRGMGALGERNLDRLNRGEGLGGGVVVVQAYDHRIFDAFVADHLRRPTGTLRKAVRAGKRAGRRRRNGA